MNLKIKIGGTNVALSLPMEMAAVAVALLQNGKLVKQEGYQADSPWVPVEEGLQINTDDDTPVDPRIATAKKEAEQKNSMWYQEYTKNQKIEKELDELKVALATLKGQVSCTQAAPVADEPEIAF